MDLTSSSSWVGLAVFDGCPTTGGTVAASATGSAGSKSVSFTPVAGNTYYVVASTWPTPNCITSFDLSIGEAVSGLSLIHI